MPLRLRCSLTLHSSFLPSLLRSKRWVGTRCGLPSNTGTASPPCCGYAAWAEGACEADIEATQHAMAFNTRAIKRAATAEASTGDSPQATVPSVVPQPSSVIVTVRRGHLSVDLPIATLRQQVTRGIARIVLSGTWVTDYAAPLCQDSCRLPTFVHSPLEDDMTRPYSLAFKQKMVERLTGKNPLNQSQLARETGVRQQNLCRWLDEARSLPLVASDKRNVRRWSVEQKPRILAEGSELTGDQLAAFLERVGVGLPEFERWRVALEEDGQGTSATTKRIRKLERELARKEKALAEATTLLVLKKTLQRHLPHQDDDTDGQSEK